MKEFIKEWWIAIVVGSTIIALMCFVLWPRHQIMTITASEWTLGYQIDHLVTNKKYNQEYVPDGARVFNSDWARRCSTSTERDSRTGVTRSKEKCRSFIEYDFEIEEWESKRVVAKNGMYGTHPTWPTYTLAPASGPHGTGVERVDSAFQKYTLHFKNDEVGSKSLTFRDQGEWKVFEPHQFVDVTLVVGSPTSCRHLEKM